MEYVCDAACLAFAFSHVHGMPLMEFCVSECLIGMILGLYLTDRSTKSFNDMKCPEMYGVNFRTSWIMPRVSNLASERGLTNHGIGTPIGRVRGPRFRGSPREKRPTAGARRSPEGAEPSWHCPTCRLWIGMALGSRTGLTVKRLK